MQRQGTDRLRYHLITFQPKFRFRKTSSMPAKNSSGYEQDDPPFCCLDYFPHLSQCVTCERGINPQWTPRFIVDGKTMRGRKIVLSSMEKSALADLNVNVDEFLQAMRDGCAVTTLQRAWRKQALQFHPDVRSSSSPSSQPTSAVNFVRVRNSFEFLIQSLTMKEKR